MMEIYLDNAANAPICLESLKNLQEWQKKAGNASSQHRLGIEAYAEIQRCRKIIADKIGASKEDIIFTSGGSESNSMALNAMRTLAMEGRNKLLISAIEHNSIMRCAQSLAQEGIQVTQIPVDETGKIDLTALKKYCDKKTGIVSIMHSNNEIGTIQDMKEIARICHEAGAISHTDACQSLCKIALNVEDIGIDMMSVCSQKIHGPIGAGALYASDKARRYLRPMIHGEQEGGMRGGTYNTPAISGFCAAIEDYHPEENDRIKTMRSELIKRLIEGIEGSRINGHTKDTLPGIISITTPGIEAETLLKHLESKGISASAGAACDSNHKEPSHVLSAIGLTRTEAQETIRISIGRMNTIKEIENAAKMMISIATSLRRL